MNIVLDPLFLHLGRRLTIALAGLVCGMASALYLLI